MYSKLVKNDIRNSRLITAAITAFILVAAMLASLAAALVANLFGAIDNMLIEAKTPHYMQMHTGDINMEGLESFAEANGNVDAFQVLEFLNIDGAEIVIGGNTLAWSVQDNGFSVQSEDFDFLLDMDGGIAHPADGEVYVPIYYMKEGAAKVGDAVSVCGVPFTVAGFLRDSQMNASLVSSKRFLVSESGFEKIRDSGIMERLIEFRLKDASSTSAFETGYLEAGLPSNGPPAITYAIVRLMNAVTDGVMIAVLALIGLFVITVAFLCVRFTLLAKVEEDYREIGVLKAVGLRVSHIKKLYMAKYGVLAGAACAIGFLLSLPVREQFMENIRLYMGAGNSPAAGFACGLIGAAVIFFAVILYVNGILRRFRKISAAQAVRFGAPQERPGLARSFALRRNRLFSRNIFLGVKDVLSRKGLYVTMLMTLVISSFLLAVPHNIYNTISAKSFMTYMGIGECDILLGTSQTLTDDVAARTAEMAGALSRDESVDAYTVLVCRIFDMIADDGSIQHFRVDLGDHTVFPITYSKGGAPRAESDIAISAINSEEIGKTLGDEIKLVVDGEEKTLVVCGVYSDITNGGKTAKAVFETTQGELLWSSIPVAFADSSVSAAKVAQYREIFPFAKVSGVEEHMGQMLGATIAAVKTASYVSAAAAVLLTVLITLLFMKMLVVKDRGQIAILKSIGFSGLDIRKQYMTRGIIVLFVGVAVGTVLSNTAGELAGVALISSFGATAFNFVADPLYAYLFSPLLMALCVYTATLLGVSEIRAVKIPEHIKEA